MSGWELIWCESRILCTVKLFGLENVANGFLAPLLSLFCLSLFAVARPMPDRRPREKTVSGKGKGGAARTGFAAADSEILIILDADLTVPPEEFPKFYKAIVSASVRIC